MGSKVKFSKFYIIFNIQPEDCEKFDVHQIYLQLSECLEKSISSQKGGAAAFKRGPDGSFFNAFDGINESFKLLEDTIGSIGINTDENKYLKIGITSLIIY